jgi:hypothetical protein
MSVGRGVRTRPGASVGTTKSESCGVPSGERPLRATTTSASASSTPEM